MSRGIDYVKKQKTKIQKTKFHKIKLKKYKRKSKKITKDLTKEKTPRGKIHKYLVYQRIPISTKEGTKQKQKIPK